MKPTSRHRANRGQHLVEVLVGHRRAAGMHLIELLAAVTISGFLAVALGASLAQCMQVSSSTESKMLSTDIAEEIAERVRNIPFSSLPADGQHFIRINLTNPSSDNVAIENIAVATPAAHIDAVNLLWHTGGAVNVPSYAFDGIASITLSSIDSNTRICVITVTPTHSGSPFSTTTTVSKYGITAQQ